MQTDSMRADGAPEVLRRIDWPAVWTWLLCFAPVVYLGLEGGGYDPLVHDQVGLIAWWLLLIGAAVGALPRLRLERSGWVALGFLAAFVLWTGLSLSWSDSIDRTYADIARVAGYLGIFSLLVFSRGRGEGQRAVGAVAAAIAVVALAGLLSRLQPDWISAAAETPAYLTNRERLSYPIEYWNGLAGLIAIGLPLLLQVMSSARSALVRGLAAAAFPAVALTLLMTLSRGGIAAAAIAVAIFLVICSDRLAKVLALVAVGVPSAILIALLESRDALQHGALTPLARDQGSEMFWIALALCLLAGLVQIALTSAAVTGRRPRWTRVGRSHALVATAVAALVVVVVAIAAGVPGRISNGWDEFKEGGAPGTGVGRLSSVAGQNRYQLWSAAVHENASEPLVGTGSGSFELWWNQHRETDESVRDTHSLYLQTLGELGIVGLLLLVGFLGTVLVAGSRALLSGRVAERDLFAAALAGFAAFCITAVFDWMWQIPAIVVAMLALAATALADPPARVAEEEAEDGAEAEERDGDRPLPVPGRVAVAVAALIAIVAIAIPLATASLLRDSEADARAGDLASALSEARSAQSVQPATAAPRLQEALVLEAGHDYDAAGEAAQAAVERGEKDWRNWLVLSRIEAERGNAGPSVEAFRRARELNPLASVFQS